MGEDNLDFSDIFKVAKADKLIGINDWGIYDLECPLETPIVDKELEKEGPLFSTSDIFKDILYHVALSQRKVKSRILITSFYGGGKSSILYYIHKITSTQSRLKGTLVSLERDFDVNTSLHYLCVDEISPKAAAEFFSKYSQIPCMVMTINANALLKDEFVWKSFLVPEKSEKRKLIILPPWDQENLVALADARFSTFSLSEKPLKLRQILSDPSLDEIIELSNGNPKAFLKIINLIMLETASLHKDKIQVIPEEYIEDILDRAGLKTFASFKSNNNLLTRQKIDVLKTIEQATSPSRITDEFDTTRANTSQHLRGLRELNLINFEQKGKERHYYRTLGGMLLSEFVLHMNVRAHFKTN